MDYVFICVCAIFTIRGCFKGFLAMLYKLLSLMLSVFFAAKLYYPFSIWLSSQTYLTKPISNFLSKTLSMVLPGKFSSIEEVVEKIENDCLPILKSILEKLLKAISFEGELSSSQIFGFSLTNLVLKTISFVSVFLIILLIFKIIQKIFKIIIKNKNINIKNRFFGAVFGFFEGLIIFSIINILIISLGEFLLNARILEFAQNGYLSRFLTEFFNKKIISIFL